MSFRIRLLPSDHSFEAESSETLLDAALRAGVSVDYGCSSGSCGECKARLLDGQLGECRPHDYRFSELERQQGWFLSCRCTAASDLTVEAIEAGSAGDIPVQSIQAKVSKIERQGDEFLILHLRTPRTSNLRFMAGQRVDLTLSNGLVHRLPVASCPCNGMLLQFHVFHAAGDPFADFVFSELKTGDMVVIDGPNGHFTLQDASPNPLLFIAFETGFATTKSLIEHAISLDEDRSMSLYWLARSSHCHYMNNLCRSWADGLDDFHYFPLLSAEAEFGPRLEEIGRAVSANGLVDVYVSGPLELSRLAMTVLPSVGIDPQHIYTDLP